MIIKSKDMIIKSKDGNITINLETGAIEVKNEIK